jgi:crossover junction endodeoxyribonuclease RuvC
MKNIKQRILAIDPGTRNIGVAFFDGSNLRYYGVKTIPTNKSAQDKLKEGKEIILELIRDFKPNVLVVEKTFFSNNRNSALLNVFSDEIKVIGKKQRLTVLSFAANTVRKQVCEHGDASKDEVAKILVARFPELKPYLTSNRRWKEKFHRNMFDAVALGLMVSKN